MGRTSPNSPTRLGRYRVEEMSKCDAPNCRSPVATKPVIDPRRNHGYSSSSPYQEVIPSRWCMKHTCSNFFRNGGTCQVKKSPHDYVCPQHTRCPVNGCNMGKLQIIDQESDEQMAHYMRFDFCAHHKCDVLMCPEPAVQADGKPGYLPFCKKHRCGYQNCDQQSGDKINFCPKHKCKIPECRTLAEDGFQLCSRHVVCEAPGCNAAKMENVLKKGEHHKFCSLHVKCEAQACDLLKLPGAKYCIKHACTERGCNKATDMKSRYCEDHRCQHLGCDNSRCWIEKTVRGFSCSMHTCRAEECNEPVETKRLYCDEHECSKPGCLTEAVWETLCGQHLKLKYETDAKATAKTKVDDMTKQLREKEQMLIQMRVRQLEQISQPSPFAGLPQQQYGTNTAFVQPSPQHPPQQFGLTGRGAPVDFSARPATFAPGASGVGVRFDGDDGVRRSREELDEGEPHRGAPIATGTRKSFPTDGQPVPLSQRPASMAAHVGDASFTGPGDGGKGV